jgi:hypothetical protein
MSLAWYIVLEREIPGLDRTVDGKAVAKAAERLDAIAAKKKARTLMSFFSAADSELADFAADHDVASPKAGAEQWFAASDGLKTVNCLLEAASKKDFDARVFEDLQQFKVTLEAAKRNGLRWHLAIDF